MADMNNNLYSHFQKQFELHADKELLRTETNHSYSYADVEQESARLAAFITGLGLMPGDRVSVQVAKSPKCLCLYLACLRGGFVFHPLNPAYQPRELEYFLKDAEPSLVVCDDQCKPRIQKVCQALDIANVLTLNAAGEGTLISLSRDTAGEFGVVPRSDDDLGALLYSSGTTGVPKGIMLTHGNLRSNTEALVKAWDFSSSDRLLHALPVFHVHGLFVAIGCVLLSGASMRWLSSWSAELAARFLPECTVMMGVPTFYTRLLALEGFSDKTCENLRLFISGSAPLLVETFAEFESRTGHRILERYGMTETNMNTSNPLDGERKAGTVGLPLPGVSVRVVDREGAVLPAGDIGDLQVRGANVFKGYWKMPAKTSEDFTDEGFFNTGDKATVDADGYVSIVGRSKDLIITGGLNVYPREVELFLDTISGVKESAVIGVPHADFGEAVVAVIVEKPGTKLNEESVIEAAKVAVANFKVPKRVVFVPELPRNTMAKVQKNVLRESCSGLFTT